MLAGVLLWLALVPLSLRVLPQAEVVTKYLVGIANPSFSIHPLDGQHASQAGTSAQKTGEKAKSHTPWELE